MTAPTPPEAKPTPLSENDKDALDGYVQMSDEMPGYGGPSFEQERARRRDAERTAGALSRENMRLAGLLADANAKVKEAKANAFTAICENLAGGDVATENANLRVQLADANASYKRALDFERDKLGSLLRERDARIAEAVKDIRGYWDSDALKQIADRLEGKTK